MSIPKEVSDRFRAGERTDEVRFILNDPVRVTAGPHADRTGSVISIVSVEPETTFLVEPDESPWGNVQVSQSKLELVE